MNHYAWAYPTLTGMRVTMSFPKMSMTFTATVSHGQAPLWMGCSL